MKHFLIVVSLAALMSACNSGRLVSSPTAPSPAAPIPSAAPLVTYTLTGVVFEVTPSGRVPVEGVQVEGLPCDAFYHACESSRNETVTTDSNGFYTFSGLHAGQNQVIWAFKKGYRYDEQVSPACDLCFRSVTITADTRLDIELERQ